MTLFVEGQAAIGVVRARTLDWIGVNYYQRYREREQAARVRGSKEAGLDAFRWLIEELKVSLFAQELRTPIPVSYKRLEKAWKALSRS